MLATSDIGMISSFQHRIEINPLNSLLKIPLVGKEIGLTEESNNVLNKLLSKSAINRL